MDEETLNGMKEALKKRLSTYQSLEQLKKDIYDYFIFSGDAYNMMNYYDEFIEVKNQLKEYIQKRGYPNISYSRDQIHCIYTYLIAGYDIMKLDYIIKQSLSLDELEKEEEKLNTQFKMS